LGASPKKRKSILSLISLFAVSLPLPLVRLLFFFIVIIVIGPADVCTADVSSCRGWCRRTVDDDEEEEAGGVGSATRTEVTRGGLQR